MNASLDGVSCPDFIREQWQERLIIDLDASYPLDLTFDDEGLSADLSFGGYVTRCTFPWTSIYVVADRATGRGIVLEQNMPESVRRSRQAAAEHQPNTKLNVAGRPLDVAPDAEDDNAAPQAAPEGAPVAVAADRTTEVDPATKPTERPRTKSPSDADVAERRAAFRVIDGGT